MPPSLLRTQVGLGVVKLDSDGRPVVPSAQAQRSKFIVSPGPKPGQLLLTAVTEATPLEADSLVVSLATDDDRDGPRLARAIVGLR